MLVNVDDEAYTVGMFLEKPMSDSTNTGWATDERWVPVEGYQQYLVSDRGRVKKTSGEMLGLYLSSGGYVLARLARPRAAAFVHRLVAVAFIPNPDGLPFVNHLDNDKTNNAVSNLEWCTQKQNIQHAEAQGRMQRNYWVGKRSPQASLSEEQVAEIRVLYATGSYSAEFLGQKYGAGKSTIGRIVRNETYRKVSS